MLTSWIWKWINRAEAWQNVFGRNTIVLILYINNAICEGATESLQMKERLWTGVRSNITSHLGLIISFLHNAPQNSKQYNPNITKQLYEGIKMRGIHKCWYFSDRRYLQQNRNETDTAAAALWCAGYWGMWYLWCIWSRETRTEHVTRGKKTNRICITIFCYRVFTWCQ
jgi:hypothetical protein